jgi:hypothetical protein
VYAATIVKYVSERRSSPVERLQKAINWTPKKGELARPFEALDILYSGILSSAKEAFEAVDTNRGRNFLLLLRAHHLNSDSGFGTIVTGWSADRFDEILNLESGTHEVLVSDLHSLLAIHSHPTPNVKLWRRMHFYHRSFSEFLDSETRAKNLFIPEIHVKQYVSEVAWQGITRISLEPSESRDDTCDVVCPLILQTVLVQLQAICSTGVMH